MGADTGPSSRTEAIKAELVANRRVLDLEGLERWMRRTEAVSELEWFAGLCCDEGNPVPQIELFECAFRALGNSSAGELHHGADARRRWIGPVVVPQFFVCPVSNKIMENPVVIASGKVPRIFPLLCSVFCRSYPDSVMRFLFWSACSWRNSACFVVLLGSQIHFLGTWHSSSD